MEEIKARPLCQKCKVVYCAVNYKKNNKTYYRKLCEKCYRAKREKDYTAPQWRRQSLKKKNCCERCGFTSEVSAIFTMYFRDGNLRNTAVNNIHTVCANCQIWLTAKGKLWENAVLISDF